MNPFDVNIKFRVVDDSNLHMNDHVTKNSTPSTPSTPTSATTDKNDIAGIFLTGILVVSVIVVVVILGSVVYGLKSKSTGFKNPLTVVPIPLDSFSSNSSIDTF